MLQEKLFEEKDNYFLELAFSKNYFDFESFMNSNRRKIFLSIIKVFTEFKYSDDTCLKMCVKAQVDFTEWSTVFCFHADEPETLVKDILPYFIALEEYEKCAEIMKLHEVLKQKNK
jgi:CRISPR/Cas system CSM-associated protein Csm5 (group 7 of RAMP superfamily)